MVVQARDQWRDGDPDIEPADLDTPWNLPPADIVTSGQMIIPIEEEVELIITSRDVIHSHWIPALHGKKDAVPLTVQTYLVFGISFYWMKAWKQPHCIAASRIRRL